MLTCSIGKVTSVILRKSLSGLTFVEFNMPMDSYSDSPVFELAIDDVNVTYRVVGSNVYMQDDGKAVMHITGMPESQLKWMKTKPSSVESMEVSKLLKSMGLENGPNTMATFMNLHMTDGQLAIVLANMSVKTAFVNFGEGRIDYYSDLYKARPIEVKCNFKRLMVRAPIAGHIGWDTGVTGVYPDDSQVILPIGQYTNTDEAIMTNVVNNCNAISRLFSDMQSFTATHTFELGDTVVSTLTYDKKIIAAAEEHYDVNDCVTAVYHCI